MAKVTLDSIFNLQNEVSATNVINENNVRVAAAIENTLSRNGTAPNSMNAVLDMNNNRIINLPEPTEATDPVRLQDITGLDSIIGEDYLRKDAKLSDLTDIPEARDNLGLGDSATRDVGTTAGTVAAGDDPRFAVSGFGDMYNSDNLAFLTDFAAARANLGVGTGDGDLVSTNNLSDVANVATARTNLGLGGAALLSVGTTAGTVAAGDDPRFSATTLFFNVKNYGAVGDGTTDDTSAIQTAINAAGTVFGGVVYLPPGTYAITGSGLTVGSFNVFYGGVIMGSGTFTRLKKTSGSGPVITEAGNLVTMRDFLIDGNSTADTGLYVLRAHAGYQALHDNIFITGCISQCVYNKYGDTGNYRNCQFFSSACGVYYADDGHNSSFTDCWFYAVTYGVRHFGYNPPSGQTGYQPEGISYTGCKFVGLSMACALEFTNALFITVMGCTIDQFAGSAIIITNNVSYITLIGNWFGAKAAHTGGGNIINLFANCNRIKIAQNVFEGGSGWQIYYNSVSAGDIYDVEISGNTFGNSSAANGAVLIFNGSGVRFLSNYIRRELGGQTLNFVGVNSQVAFNRFSAAPSFTNNGGCRSVANVGMSDF
jgi:hypothetical protein